MSDATKFVYTPGVCNIDEKGVRFRRRLFYVTLGAGILSLVAMYWVGLPVIFRVIAAAGFGFGASLNYVQAAEQFCISNATFRTTEVGLKRSKIVDDLYKELDLKKRNAMLRKTLVITVLSALLGLLPI
ncbi:MAG: hypothetical protein JSS75_14090 [Bacteroidetes bacterium]|nr:hypothetical protein [Bacteroidota bacterium]